MRKIFSVLLCIILVISICICSSVTSSAIIVDTALITTIGLSIAASVLLSIGIAAVSGNESEYVSFAKALGQVTWEQMVQDYTQAEILSMIVVENGKAYFRCPDSLYAKIRNWAQNYDFSSLTAESHITTDSTNTIPSSSSYILSNIDGFYAIGDKTSTVSLTTPSYTVSYLPDGRCSCILADGSYCIKTANVNYLNNALSVVCTALSSNGDISIFTGGKISGGNVVNAYPENADRTFNSLTAFSFYNGTWVINGNSYTFSGYSSGGRYKVTCNGTVIANVPNQSTFSKNCLASGSILSNVSNNIFDTNSNSDLSTVQAQVETETKEPAIPGNRIGSNQTALIPIPSHFEDPSLPGVPLPQRTVKNRVKRGQEVALVPDISDLKDKTPQDLGVLVVNNTDVQDTVISPTLSTTHYGEDSTTYAILPQVPVNTPIPNDDNQPLVSNPYPDVINPGNETISINAGDDVFPTASNPPVTTARPSVSVSNPDEVGSSVASEVVEGVSEIASEAVKDIAEPLTPSDIEKGANRMKLTPQLLSKFPFCIPFDFYNAINQFSAPAEVPQFDIPIEIQSLNFHYDVHVDLTQYETAAKISRWLFSVAWVITLIFLTRKVIWK